MRLATFGIQAVEFAPAIADEEKPIGNGRSREHVPLKRIGPHHTVSRDIASFGGVDAFEPGLILAPENIAPAGDIDAVLIKHGHAVNVAWSLAVVGEVRVDVALRSGGIKIELPDGLKRDGESRLCRGMAGKNLFRSDGAVEAIERVDDPIAPGEEDQGPAIDCGHGRGGPGAMKNVSRDGLAVAR